ncbi:MAG TPA: hypothetical protein DDW83_09120 [Peptococcaceae bacterium]|jgi:ferrous iron transport protein A|nr:hypothetical protein [Peptococcaceae bacterium]
MRKDNMMTLKSVGNGKAYIVEKSLLKQPVKRRLEAMGLIEGTMIHKINEALDGSIICIVKGTRLAIGKELAERIFVRPMSASDIRHRRHRKRCRGMGPRDGSGRGSGMNRKRGGVGQAKKRGEAIDSEK